MFKKKKQVINDTPPIKADEFQELENEFQHIFSKPYIRKLKRIISEEDFNEFWKKYIQFIKFLGDEGFTHDQISFCCGSVLSSINKLQKEEIKFDKWRSEMNGI